MSLTTYKKFKGDRLMPWGKATVVTGAKGYVFLSGNTATADDYDPLHQRGGAVGDPAMQWRAILANIKSDLEEVGSSLEHLVKLTFYVKGPFPNGGVLSSPNFRLAATCCAEDFAAITPPCGLTAVTRIWSFFPCFPCVWGA
jgi:enamine deaminase RidA (YjgF/YER057c/UK114 family)